jgi:hypothetical protein
MRKRTLAKRWLASGLFLWVVAVTALHLGLNVDWVTLQNDQLPEEQRRLNVGYLPVT